MTVYLIGVEWIWDLVFMCHALLLPAASGISLRQHGPPSAQGKYCDIPLITIPSVELYRSKAKTSTTMITEEEERRILTAASISTSAAAFKRRRFPSSEHRRRGALTPPDCCHVQICVAVVPPPLFPFLFSPQDQPREAVRNLLCGRRGAGS